ncbi:hypothetical protein FRC08_015315, partial [Ceratobasidium sp. 394]
MSHMESRRVLCTIDKRAGDSTQVANSDGHGKDDAALEITASVIPGPGDCDWNGWKDAARGNDGCCVAYTRM